jgi:large subunit ribosomal protein L30
MSKTSKSKEKIVRITLVRSTIGFTKRHKATVRALGLRRLHQTVEHKDTPTLRGMLYLVERLVEVEE